MSHTEYAEGASGATNAHLPFVSTISRWGHNSTRRFTLLRSALWLRLARRMFSSSLCE